jgi:ketosteroid isomerase-like protein
VVVEFEQIIDAGDRLVSIHKARTKARHTGIEIETPLVYLWTLRDGKVVHFRAFVDVEQALEVAGLRES